MQGCTGGGLSLPLILLLLLLLPLLTHTQGGPRSEDKCQNPLPLFLTQPHTHVFHLTLENKHDVLFKTQVLRSGYLNSLRKVDERNLVDMKNHITEEEIRMAYTLGGEEYKENYDAILNELMEEHIHLKDKPGLLLSLFNAPSGETSNYSLESKQGIISEIATKKIQNAHDFKATSLSTLGLHEVCLQISNKKQTPDCDIPPSRAKFRTPDGTCNNLDNPLWGASFIPFERIANPHYGDDVKTLRLDSAGKPLPSPRLVSTTVNIKPPPSTNCFTLLHMTMGQFLDHDLTSTPISKGKDGTNLPCCSVINNPDRLHPECAPIMIPKDDPLYSAYGSECLHFVRSEPAGKCTLGPREQKNQVTSYMDGSAVYGSTANQARKLRAKEDGLLAMQTKDGQELLPPSRDRDDGCNLQTHFDNNRFCFTSGDIRANEQILLTLVTTIFARLHNKYARELKILNPSWDDERLYQETKRICVAVFQHIVYNEFVPGVLGPAFAKKLGLTPQKGGKYTTDYDPTISATIANEFATAAYRFGHSMIPDNFYQVDINGTITFNNLNDVIFHPFKMYDGRELVNMARGSISQVVGDVDTKFAQEITGRLFRGGGTNPGFDLVAINIQRGRDHGLAPYTVVREACGLGTVRSFDDLSGDIDRETLGNLEKVYKNVHDIDLFIGGLAEQAIAGAQVGPTIACVLGNQFLRLKRGDRYWYENKDSPGAFTTEQLAEIHETSMGRVLCDTVLEMEEVQRWPFKETSIFNPKLPCSSPCFPKINLTLWKE